MLVHKIDFERKIAICLHKKFINVRLKEKNYRQQTNKEINETNNIKNKEKVVFPKDFSHAVYLSLS